MELVYEPLPAVQHVPSLLGDRPVQALCEIEPPLEPLLIWEQLWQDEREQRPQLAERVGQGRSRDDEPCLHGNGVEAASEHAPVVLEAVPLIDDHVLPLGRRGKAQRHEIRQSKTTDEVS